VAEFTADDTTVAVAAEVVIVVVVVEVVEVVNSSHRGNKVPPE